MLFKTVVHWKWKKDDQEIFLYNDIGNYIKAKVMVAVKTYLGTILTNNGNFKVSIQEPCKSARRAMRTLLVSTNKFASGNLKV